MYTRALPWSLVLVPIVALACADTREPPPLPTTRAASLGPTASAPRLSGTSAVLRGSLDVALNDDWMAIATSARASTYRLEGFARSERLELGPRARERVVLGTFGADIAEVDVTIGGAAGDDVDLVIEECIADVCAPIAFSAGATDVERTRFAPRGGHEYVAAVQGYAVANAAARITIEETARLATPIEGTLRLRGAADRLTVEYEAKAAALLDDRRFVLDGWDVAGEIALAVATGEVWLRVPVRARAGDAASQEAIASQAGAVVPTLMGPPGSVLQGTIDAELPVEARAARMRIGALFRRSTESVTPGSLLVLAPPTFDRDAARVTWGLVLPPDARVALDVEACAPACAVVATARGDRDFASVTFTPDGKSTYHAVLRDATRAAEVDLVEIAELRVPEDGAVRVTPSGPRAVTVTYAFDPIRSRVATHPRFTSGEYALFGELALGDDLRRPALRIPLKVTAP